MDFAALGAKAGADSPQGLAASAVIPGRVLLMDGDGLAYCCAGSDDTDIGQARRNLFERIRQAKATSAAERVIILMTGSGSPKGDRFFIARVKPYQGQRSSDRRPTNWVYLRQILSATQLEVPGAGTVDIHTERYLEADDCFAIYAKDFGPECTVVNTQDKDMRMVCAWHLNWDDWSMFYCAPGTWKAEHNGKVFGRQWFWRQMMHGDQADNIPGLPFYTDGSITKSGPNKGQLKVIKVGDKAAVLAELDSITNDRAAATWALHLYMTCYGTAYDACLNMLEQGILLWIRPGLDVLDVAVAGHPLHCMSLREDWPQLAAEMHKRVKVGCGLEPL